MPDMTSNLDRIVAHLRRLERRAPDLLQPPLSLRQIQLAESKLPFSLTGELETIYQWRNGTKADAGELLEFLYFFPGFYFLSLEEAIEKYEESEDAPQWKKGWFPLFANGAGDFYIVPCKKKKIASSEIIGFLHGEPEQTAEYESLDTMIQTIEACFRQGAFFVDDDDTMEIDDDKHQIIAHKFNPTIPEWQS
jgi:hypothetical protein